MPRKSVLQILTDARALVADAKTWTRGSMARRADGHPTSARSSTATCFCALGALTKASDKRGGGWDWDAYNALGDELAGSVIVGVNDGPRGRYRILKAFDRAIKKLTPKVAA